MQYNCFSEYPAYVFSSFSTKFRDIQHLQWQTRENEDLQHPYYGPSYFTDSEWLLLNKLLHFFEIQVRYSHVRYSPESPFKPFPAYMWPKKLITAWGKTQTAHWHITENQQESGSSCIKPFALAESKVLHCLEN